MVGRRSPGIRLFFVGLVALVLVIPLVMVYALVGDREQQSQTAQAQIVAGWGGSQVVSSPILAIPYMRESSQTEVIEGRSVTRTTQVRDQLFLAPATQAVRTTLKPQSRSYSIYSSVIYEAALAGEARFELPEDLERFGVGRDRLLLDQAELRFGVSDPRGLMRDATVSVGGRDLRLQPGKGVAASGNSGFFGFVELIDGEPLDVRWRYGLRGSRSLAFVPRGGETRWEVTSPWPHPSFRGSFLPEESEVGNDGFSAHYSVSNLALGQSLAMTDDPGAPTIEFDSTNGSLSPVMVDRADGSIGPAMAASIGLIEPVDLYSRVDRSVKYGFLFIGFTFLAFLMFDIVGGARVATAEYLLTGAGLVLFFVLLLAFAEVIGFTLAYALASAAIIGLLTSYSAAVLKTWRRARFIGALLVGLYALIYVLLSLEALSLVIGAVLLFVALAGVMYATRNVDWSAVGRQEEPEA
jgi:inner membrane protein